MSIIRQGIDAEARVLRRALNPKSDVFNLYKTFDYSPWIKEHLSFMSDLIESKNKVTIHNEMRNRIEINGMTASFPEFRGVVGYLIKSIFQSSDVLNFHEASEERMLRLDLLVSKLIVLETRYNFPYLPTIIAIEEMLSLLDIYQRVTSKTKFSPYYHTFRYRSYLDYLAINKTHDNILLPTFKFIGTRDLIKLRSVPMMIVQVSKTPKMVDMYFNTSIELWSHDLQHARRQYQETLYYYDTVVKHRKYNLSRSPFDLVTLNTFYEEMDSYINDKISDLITQNDDRETHLTQLFRIIIFEVSHEKAIPITKENIIKTIKTGYDIFPVESICVDSSDNGHLKIQNEIFNDPKLLANIRGKLRHGFYDDVNNPNDKIVQREYRTTYWIARAAQLLLKEIDEKDNTSLEFLMEATSDSTNAGEFSQVSEIDIPDDFFPKTC